MAMLSNYLRRRDSTDELLAVLSPLRPSAAAQGEIALRRFSRAIVAALGFAYPACCIVFRGDAAVGEDVQGRLPWSNRRSSS